jgi:hypothetical protein
MDKRKLNTYTTMPSYYVGPKRVQSTFSVLQECSRPIMIATDFMVIQGDFLLVVIPRRFQGAVKPT